MKNSLEQVIITELESLLDKIVKRLISSGKQRCLRLQENQ
jgi:hypothetical protein